MTATESDAGTMYANTKALHELLQESRAENAELRKELAADEPLFETLNDANDRLLAENAELRELVRVMAYCMQYERECDGCRLNGADGTITAPVGCDGLHERLRELGVEV